METKAGFLWADFYMELANKLLPYRNNRGVLIKRIQAIYSAINVKLPKLEDGDDILDMDPFTVFALFNRGISTANRIAVLRGFALEFSINSPIPEAFDGVPIMNNQAAVFYRFIRERGEHDIDNLWQLFISALKYADTHSDSNKTAFVSAYNEVAKQKGIKWNLTIPLFWMRPYEYISLDSRTRGYISSLWDTPDDSVEDIVSFDTAPNGEEYLAISEAMRTALEEGDYECRNLPELSYYAWLASKEVNKNSSSKADEITRADLNGSIHYWIYSPGYGSAMWDRFFSDGVMAIAHGYMGDLSQYSSREEMRRVMLEYSKNNPDLKSNAKNFRNVSLEAWQFANELKSGDVVFAKKGKHTILGRGIVASEYYHDADSPSEYKSFRRVNWTHKGEWDYPGNVTKILTDITDYPEYYSDLNTVFEGEPTTEHDSAESVTEPVKCNGKRSTYTKTDFLREVFISGDNYDVLSDLLSFKKNIILQGAPGVGKTFAAKRLAYAKMGVKDDSRIMMVQFHQSYSYEDFIMGFRPNQTGAFELKTGPFYNFCKKAREDSKNDYYLIIDEINRGNMSKIFGELFMLIESDKRGQYLQLLYSDEQFTVPENIYIIGMMNTADRSLAMLDYALRRRFAFYELPPAFESDGFRKYQRNKNNKKFDNLISAVEKLNADIENDDALGKGFRIGHSYFCINSNKAIDDAWLNCIVSFEIVPLLAEYWFDEPDKVQKWENALREAIR